MSSIEDQARTGATRDVQVDAASRTFAHEPGEGEALWWVGMLPTIKSTAERTNSHQTLNQRGSEELAPRALGGGVPLFTQLPRRVMFSETQIHTPAYLYDTGA